MHYDVVIIGAGMSGLAAGIRLAYFDQRVLIVEKHYAYGGLNSYYKLGGREFDVGLHAVTNYVENGNRNAPLPKLLRQLRLTLEDFDLRPQRYSEIRFPGRTLRFTNDLTDFTANIAELFPREADRFTRMLADIQEFEDTRLDRPYTSARKRLTEYIHDPVLIEMLLCPIMYYGSAEEHDMDFTQFVTMFKSLFCEGFARPPGGVRTIIKALVKKYRSHGGKLKMRCGVERIEVDQNRVTGINLSTGETITADTVISSAGYVETMQLCADTTTPPRPPIPGQISFVETILVLDKLPHTLGHSTTIVFFNDADKFTYAVPDQLVDLRSGVACCPTNYQDHEDSLEGLFRVTWLASAAQWSSLDKDEYLSAKERLLPEALKRGQVYMPDIGDHIVFSDMFTPQTIQRFTGHLNGAVYGSPQKIRDGRTHLKNLFICGTDQGFLGIIGAMLSGITIANLHVLMES